LIGSFVCWLVCLFCLVGAFVVLLVDWFVAWFIDSFFGWVDLLVGWSGGVFIVSFIDWFDFWLVGLLIGWLVGLFVHCLVVGWCVCCHIDWFIHWLFLVNSFFVGWLASLLV
jgi:hypothetical protein